MKSATLTVTNRPHYLREVLKSIEQIDWSGFRLYIGLEPMCAECASICESIDFVETEIIYNETCLGINDNPFNLLDRAFGEGSEYNVYLEDDVVLSPDILDMTDWYLKQDHTNVMHLQFFQSNSTPSFPESMLIHDLFLCWGFVCTAQQWKDHIRKAWRMNPQAKTWDVSVWHYMRDQQLDGYVPMFSRARNIGSVGTNATDGAELNRLTALPHYEGGSTIAYRVENEVPLHTRFTCDTENAARATSILDEFEQIFETSTGCITSDSYLQENDQFWVSQTWTSLAAFHECIRSRYDLLGELETICPTGIQTTFSEPGGSNWIKR